MKIRILESGSESSGKQLAIGEILEAEPVIEGSYSFKDDGGVFIQDRTAILITGEYEIVEE